LFFKLKKLLDGTLEFLVTISMGVLVIDVVWQVITRYLLKNPSSWTEELATFLMIWVGLLGAGVALNRGAHLGIDYIVSKMSQRKAMYVSLFVFTLIMLFSLLVMVIGGIQLVHRILITNQVSPALGLKMGYVYLAIPISGLFLVIYSIELFFKTLAGGSKTIKDEPL
jgi:TRAP-type C4-dicarboxylate transport system permease small subunit